MKKFDVTFSDPIAGHYLMVIYSTALKILNWHIYEKDKAKCVEKLS